MATIRKTSSSTSKIRTFSKYEDPIVRQFRLQNGFHDDDDDDDEVINTEEALIVAVPAPIISSCNDRIRPLLDAIDRLRNLKVMKEGIELPTIVVVGDQSSGKSSVLESLAGISLPRGQGVCTRVPLIMRLQNHDSPSLELSLEYNGKVVYTDEYHIAEAISTTTDEIAGKGKGISSNPLTLFVRKNGVPDLTMVDLPGITRVPVHGQPEDIYEQISKTIMEYISPKESIILNVLSASVDFSTCESIRMSQKVDKTGERTLAVVTKADKSPEGLFEKVMADDVNIGLGYVCVRNRIGDESYEEARNEEARLFESNWLLSQIDKTMIGIPILAERLVKIQATIIVKCLSEIIRKINGKLAGYVEDMNKLPKNMGSIAEAIATFVHVLAHAKESLKKILIQGEFDEFPDSPEMHCTARMAEMLNKYFDELKSYKGEDKFLVNEIHVLEETKAIGLPNFLPRAAFLALLQKQMKGISVIPSDFVEKVWSYIEKVVVSVLMSCADNYPQLLSSIRRAAQNLVGKKKELSLEWVNDLVEMEKLTDYTSSPEYMAAWTKLMAQQGKFIEAAVVQHYPAIVLDEFGLVEIVHLHQSKESVVREAFDVKMRMTAYWKIVLGRLVDSMALHLLYSVQKLVMKEIEKEITNEVILGPQGNLLERLLEESSSIAEKRKRLKNSIELLKESKDVVASIMDRVESDFD